MTHRVQLRTAVPTLEEFGENLGLSKARQKGLISIVRNASATRKASFESLHCKKSGAPHAATFIRRKKI